jgi:hypothetical protein
VRAMPSRASRPGHAQPRLGRVAGAAVLTLGLLFAGAGCGMDAQTMKPYTPAEGVNVDVGNATDPDAVVHVRNLLVVSKTAGSGVVSASMVTSGRDQLTGLSGVPIKADGSQGAPFKATLTNTVSLANGAQIVLTDIATPITVTSPDLAPGLTTSITLDFQNAGSVTLNTTVADGNQPQYASISPAPATPAATP